MIGFWIAVALLVAIALWFIVRPLLRPRVSAQVLRSRENIAFYRDQLRDLEDDLKRGAIAPEQYERAKREIEARLLEDVGTAEEKKPAPPKPARAMALALLAVVPLGAFAIYLVVGAPATLDPQFMAANDPKHAVDRQELEVMVGRLAEKLKQEPDNVEGWIMLARSYRHFGRFDEAARAYAHLLSRVQPDADLLADYADTLAMAQGRTLRGEPEKLVARALELDPQHLKALALAGSVEFEKKNFASAAKYWERMVPLVPADSEQAKAIRANVDEARGLAGLGAYKPVAASAPSGEGRVSGVVKLAPELAAKVAPTDSVLIYARPASGSRMPLAIVRREARELPVKFTLDDTSAMTPEMTLSKHDRVIIAARVSKNPGAAAQPGDFEGASAPVNNTAKDVDIVINTVVR